MVYLPRVADQIESRKTTPVLVAPGGSETVLLVEDFEPVRKLVEGLLSRTGYCVLTASDGDEGLQLLKKHAGPIHLVITDVVMPRIGGQELAQQVAQLRPDTKVLYTSGYTEQEVFPTGAVSPNQYLQKPFSPTDLLKKVREVLVSPS